VANYTLGLHTMVEHGLDG